MDKVVVLKKRPCCSRCGAEHTVDNRVNWWDSNGMPYGLQTREMHSDEVLHAWCDKCAMEMFAPVEELLSGVAVGYAIESEKQSILHRFDLGVFADREDVEIAKLTMRGETVSLMAYRKMANDVIQIVRFYCDKKYSNSRLAYILCDFVFNNLVMRDCIDVGLWSHMSNDEAKFLISNYLKPTERTRSTGIFNIDLKRL